MADTGPGKVKRACGCGFVRAATWGVALVVASFPAVSASHIRPSINPYLIAIEVNQHGYFRDLFFVVIIMAAVGATNLFDFLHDGARKRRNTRWWASALAFGSLCFYFIALMYGTFHFSSLAALHEHPVPIADVLADLWVLIIVVTFSFLTEMLICIAD